MAMLLSERAKLLSVLDPVADGYNGDPATTRLSLQDYNHAAFLLSQDDGGGGTGKATITVEASSDNAGTGAEAIAFKLRRIDNTSSPADLMQDLEEVTASGVDTTAAAAPSFYLVEVKAAALPADKPYVGLKLTEAVDDPCTVSCVAYLTEGRYRAEHPSAL